MSSKRNITYKCPYCDKRFNKENLVIHVGNKHDEMIPENYSAFRLVFDYVNKKPSGYNGKCIICGNESGWDEEKGKYNRLCSNPVCKKKYIQSFEERMIRSKGVKRISATAEGQAKMLANRKISGEYKFQDGGIRTYTGTYEKKALEFMDKVMNIKSEDVSTPGPIMEYMFEGKKHIYISDIYYAPYNLIIEVKDGGDNPNNRSMPEYRAKQIAKEKYIIKETDFNYLRLTNNDFSQLLAVFMELKMEMSNDTPERVIRINEGFFKDLKKAKDDKKSIEENKQIIQFIKDNKIELMNFFKNNYEKDVKELLNEVIKEIYNSGIVRDKSYNKDRNIKDYIKFIPNIKAFEYRNSKFIYPNIYLIGIDKNLFKKSNDYFGYWLFSDICKSFNKNNNFSFEITYSDNDPIENSLYIKYNKNFISEFKKEVLKEEYIEEGFLKSEPDILYNKEAFDNSDINICFVIGHSGSGKSTLAHGKESDTVEVYELDDLQCIKDTFTMDNLKEYGDLIYSFFNGPGKKFYITYDELIEQNIPGSEYEDKLYKEFVAYAINYAKKHKDKKYILEGVWIFCYDEKGKPYFEPSYFKDYAFYIKGTSAIKSKWRAALRDSKYDGSLEPKYKGFKRLKGFTKQFFTKNWKWYKLDEKRIQVFRDYFKNKPETVLSEAYSGELGKIQRDPEIIDSYGFISSDGIYNENVKIKGFNKWLRGRSELLILDGDKLYLKKDLKKGYSIPGGGWEKDEDHNLSAIRETNEEARIKVKNVSYICSYVSFFDPKDWVKERISEENWWYGEYIELYIGEYDGQYKGKVDKIDQDKAMENGKFYNIKSVYNELISVHQEALSDIVNEAMSWKESDDKIKSIKRIYYGLTESESKKKSLIYKGKNKGVNVTLEGLIKFLKDNDMQDTITKYVILDIDQFDIDYNIKYDEKYDMFCIKTPFEFEIKNPKDINYSISESYIEESALIQSNTRIFQYSIEKKYPDKVLDNKILKKLITLLNKRLTNGLKTLYYNLKKGQDNDLKIELFDLEKPSLNTFINSSFIKYINIDYSHPDDEDAIYYDKEVYTIHINIINPYLVYDELMDTGVYCVDRFQIDNSNIKFIRDEINSFHESVLLEASISRYKKVKIDRSLIESDPVFKHLREDHCRGYAFYDKDKLVGFVNVEDKGEESWIQALEIMPDYRNQGLGNSILDIAVKELKANYLSVNKKNTVAISMYKKYGFKTYKETDTMYFMSLKEELSEASISNYKFLDIKSNKSKALEYLKANSETKSYAEDTVKNYNGELVIYNDIMIGRILIGDKRDKGFITDFSIDEEHRGNKLGSKLIDDAINKYHGIDLLVNKDNKLAIDMYKRRGFVVIKTIKNQYWMKLESKLKEDTNMNSTSINEGLINIIKKWNDKSLENDRINQEKQRAKKLGLTQDQYKKYMNYKLDSEDLKKANEMFDNFRKYTLDLFKKLKSDSEFKKKVQNVYDKYINDDSVELSKFPPLKIFDFDKIGKDGEGQIMIFNNGDDSIYYAFIYDYIKKDMKENHKDIDFIYNTGDGDEGSIWVNVWTEKYKNYIINKIKSQSVNEAMNALLTGYIPGSVDNPNNTYIVNYMQNNIFSGEDPNEGIGVSDNPKLTNLVIRDKDGILKRVDESFLDDKTYKVYIIELSKEEVSNRLSKYMGESVEKGFIYETLLGKKLYTNDQIQFESKLTPIMDYYESMDTFKEICDNYFFAKDKKEESINESTFIPKEVRYFNNSGLMYSDKVYTLNGYINSKSNKVLECLDITIKE